MSCRADAWPDNATGEAVFLGQRWSFYVDRSCIVCAVCRTLAPANFRLADDEDHDIVANQPRTVAELVTMQRAAASCPVDAIGMDPEPVG